MCEFSHDNSKLITLKKKDAILGSRFIIYDWKENTIKSLYQDYYYPKNKAIIKTTDIPNLNGDLGLYNYNNNYNNNYYYYNYNNYNYNNYYNYTNYNNYKMALITKAYGKIVIHDLGHRSQSMEILAVLSLKSNNNNEFMEHFNWKCEQLAKQLKIKVIPFQFGENPVQNYLDFLGEK